MKFLVISMFLSLAVSVQAKIHQFSQLNPLSEANVSIEKVNENIVVRFSINALLEGRDKNSGFSKIAIPGLSNTKEVDVASMPYKSFLVESRPEDINVSVNWGKAQTLGHVLVNPSTPEKCRCKKEVFHSLNVQKYQRGVAKGFRLEYLGDFRGTPLTRVLLIPADFDGNNLVVFPDAQFSIENANSLFEMENMDSNFSEKNYLVVVPSAFAEAIRPLTDYRSAQGYHVKTVIMEDLGKTYEEIKTGIHNIYHNEFQFKFALFVGHEGIFPTNYVRTQFDSNTPSDLEYFTFGGVEDRIPDAFYGRIVADNSEEISRQIQKIKEYEGNESPAKNHIGIASNEGSDPSDVEYVQNMFRPFQSSFSMVDNFFFQDNANSNVTDINAVFSKGVSWVNYIGHGIGDSWPSINSGEYMSADIKDISPNKTKPVIIDVACQNGRFSYEGRLGERFMNETNNGQAIGAVAYYGGSVDISWHPPAIMAIGISKNVGDAGERVLGKALFAGQMYLMDKHSVLEDVIFNLSWYHLQGDPALNIVL